MKLTSISALVETAEQRSLGMKIAKKRRVDARKQRLVKQKHPSSSLSSPNVEGKVRALIAAIRSYTNADVEMNVDMPANKLFEVAVQTLSAHSSAIKNDSKLIGDTIDVISRLNEVLQKW